VSEIETVPGVDLQHNLRGPLERAVGVGHHELAGGIVRRHADRRGRQGLWGRWRLLSCPSVAAPPPPAPRNEDGIADARGDHKHPDPVTLPYLLP
jgi:hypothetical protein